MNNNALESRLIKSNLFRIIVRYSAMMIDARSNFVLKHFSGYKQIINFEEENRNAEKPMPFN